MAAILGPKFKIAEIRKVSTPEFDKGNGGYGEYEIVAEVRFSLYSPDGNTEKLKKEALDKLDHALS